MTYTVTSGEKEHKITADIEVKRECTREERDLLNAMLTVRIQSAGRSDYRLIYDIRKHVRKITEFVSPDLEKYDEWRQGLLIDALAWEISGGLVGNA